MTEADIAKQKAYQAWAVREAVAKRVLPRGIVTANELNTFVMLFFATMEEFERVRKATN